MASGMPMTRPLYMLLIKQGENPQDRIPAVTSSLQYHYII